MMRLPDLSKAKCRMLVACGNLKTKDKRVLQWMKDKLPVMTRYGPRGKQTYAFAMLGGRSGKHVHLDLYAHNRVPDDLREEQKLLKPDEFQTELAKLDGHVIKVNIDGYFDVLREHLPLLITTALRESKADGVSIQTVGGTLAVIGAPINRIGWYVPMDDNEAVIHLAGEMTTKIGDDYLEAALRLVESAFAAFIQEE